MEYDELPLISIWVFHEAMWVGENAEQATYIYIKAGLFQYFTRASFGQRLAWLHVTAGYTPFPVVGAALEKDAFMRRVKNPGRGSDA